MPHTFDLQLALNTVTDSPLSTILHGIVHRRLEEEEADRKPEERVSSLLHEAQRQPVSLNLTSAHPLQPRLCLTVLRDEWVQVFKDAFASGKSFGRQDDATRGRIEHARLKPWSLQRLQTSILALEAPKHLEIRFTSPTVFMQKHAAWDTPFPDLVFKSLEARWTDFGGTPLPADATSLVTECVERVHYDAQRQRLDFGRHPLPAFTGRLRLTLCGAVEGRLALVTLAAFGVRVNVGKRVAYGCGSLQGRVRLDQPGQLIDLSQISDTP